MVGRCEDLILAITFICDAKNDFTDGTSLVFVLYEVSLIFLKNNNNNKKTDIVYSLTFQEL